MKSALKVCLQFLLDAECLPAPRGDKYESTESKDSGSTLDELNAAFPKLVDRFLIAAQDKKTVDMPPHTIKRMKEVRRLLSVFDYLFNRCSNMSAQAVS